MARDTMASDDTAGGPPDDTWQPVEDTGFIGHVGPMFAKEAEDGTMLLAFRGDEHHRNLSGVVQGGMMMTLADRGMGRAARTAAQGRVATVHMAYDFISPGFIGTWIELHPKVAKRVGSLFFMECEVIVDGELVGRGNGIWKKLNRAPLGDE